MLTENTAPINFSGFANREHLLTSIIRYHPYKPMWYRTNLWIHSNRVRWMVEELAPIALTVWPNFEIKAARIMAAIHDDMEIIMGDVQLGDKIAMNDDKQAELAKRELSAIADVAKRFPKTIHEYDYQSLLERYNVLNAEDKEALLVKYCDKMDGYCEALHELYSGNRVFTERLTTSRLIPTEVYPDILNSFRYSYTVSAPLFEKDHLLLQQYPAPDPNAILEAAAVHTAESIRRKTGHPHYDAWKRITLECGKEWGEGLLTERVE